MTLKDETVGDVERVANAIEIAMLNIESDARVDSLTDEELHDMARAAIAALSRPVQDGGERERMEWLTAGLKDIREVCELETVSEAGKVSRVYRITAQVLARTALDSKEKG